MAGGREDLYHARSDIDAIVSNWLSEDTSILHLIGVPGSGKSVWARLFSENFALHEELGVQLALAHFCNRSDVTTTNAYGFVQQLTCGLADASSSYAARLAQNARLVGNTSINVSQTLNDADVEKLIGVTIEKLQVGGMTAAEIFSQLVLTPLREIGLEETEPVVVLVDALDESLTAQTGTTITDLLFALGKAPPNLKIIVTSRDTGDLALLARQQGAKITDVSDAAAVIGKFLERQFRHLAIEGSKDTKAATIQRVQDVARGNFLIAHFASTWVLERGAHSDSWSTDEMPSDLGSFYLASMSRSIRADPSDWGKFAVPVLGLLSVARRPLTMEEMVAISGLERHHVRMVVEIYRQFLSIGSEGEERDRLFRFFHASFPEFLQNEILSGRYFLPAKDQHLRIYKSLEHAAESGDWREVTPYLLIHAIPHTIEAFGRKCQPFLEKVISNAFLKERTAQDPYDMSLLQDLSTCIAMSRDNEEIKATFTWASIRALILQSFTDQIHSDSLTVLAASGECEEAVRLLMVQMLDLGLDGSSRMAVSRPEAFFSDLGLLASAQVIDEILANLPEMIRRDALLPIVNSLASCDVHGAASILGKYQNELEEPYFLSDSSIRHFSSHPETYFVSDAAKNVGEKFKAEKAIGRATYDLQGALADLADIRGFNEDYGGTRMYLRPKHLAYQAAAWHVRHNPQNVRTVLELFRERLSAEPSVFAAALALEIAFADPHVGVEALSSIEFGRNGWLRCLTATMMQAVTDDDGARSGVAVFMEPGSDNIHFVTVPVQSVVALIQAFDPLRLRYLPDSSKNFERVFNWLLASIKAGDDIEFKYQAAEYLGRAVGYLAPDMATKLYNFAKDVWSSNNGPSNVCAGLAEGFAARSTAEYLTADKSGLFPEFESHGATLAAAEARLMRDPRSAIEILDAVDPRYSRTRGAIARKIAIGLAQADDIAALTQVRSRMSAFHESAIYLEFVRSLEVPPPAAEARWPMLMQFLKSAPEDARNAEVGFMDSVVSEMRRLPDNVSTVLNGIHIFPWDVAGLVAETVNHVDPIGHYVIGHDTMHLCNLEAMARAALDVSSTLALPDDTAKLVTEILNRIGEFRNHGAKLRVIASFAGPLSKVDALAYVKLLPGLDDLDRSLVETLIGVLSAPNDVLEEMRTRDHSEFDALLAAPAAASFIAKTKPLEAIRSVDGFGMNLAANMLEAIVQSCPLDDWRGIADEVLDWKHSDGVPGPRRITLAEDAVRHLLQRTARYDPLASFEVARELEYVSDVAMKEVVVAACWCASIPDETYSALCDKAMQIGDGDYRLEAFSHLLFAAAGRPEDNGALRLCHAVASFSAGGNRTLLDAAEAFLSAWKAEAPTFDDDVRNLSKSLKSLFADKG